MFHACAPCRWPGHALAARWPDGRHRDCQPAPWQPGGSGSRAGGGWLQQPHVNCCYAPSLMSCCTCNDCLLPLPAKQPCISAQPYPRNHGHTYTRNQMSNRMCCTSTSVAAEPDLLWLLARRPLHLCRRQRLCCLRVEVGPAAAGGSSRCGRARRQAHAEHGTGMRPWLARDRCTFRSVAWEAGCCHGRPRFAWVAAWLQ